jgi:hypothetical protein
MNTTITKIPVTEWREDAPAILEIRIRRSDPFHLELRYHVQQVLSLLNRRHAGGAISYCRPRRNGRLALEPPQIKYP